MEGSITAVIDVQIAVGARSTTASRGVDQHSARKLMDDYLRQMTSGDGF